MLLGLLISIVYDRITASQILHLTANENRAFEKSDENLDQKPSEFAKNTPAIFIVEKYRKRSQVNNPYLMGIDNKGLDGRRMEEV